MKKLGIILVMVVMVVMVGCASTRNTVNRLQGDIEYFQNELVRYALVIGEDKSSKALKILASAEGILIDAEKASLAGDKLAEKKYLSALVDIMDLLAKYEDGK